MLNNRCSHILHRILYSQMPIKIESLAQDLSVSERTVRYDLDHIDEYLIDEGFNRLLRKPNEGISLLLANIKRQELLCCIHNSDTYEYVLSQNERIIYILYDLLERDIYTTVQQLADKMLVSKTTIQNDIKEIKVRLGLNRDMIETSKGKGIKFVGDEVKLRKMASKLLFDHFDTLNLFNVNFISLFNDVNIGIIQDAVKEAEKQLKNTFSDYAFNNLVIHLAIAVKRIEMDKDIRMDAAEFRQLTKTAEFAVAAGIARKLEDRFHIIIPDNEIGYIAIHLLGSNFSLADDSSHTPNENDIYIQMLVSTLIEKMSTTYGVDFTLDEQLYENLLQHMRSAIYRFKHKININNPLLTEIQEQYVDIFNCVRHVSAFLEKDLQTKVSAEECGYISIHFMTSRERMKNSHERKARVLIVCATGVGTSKFVLLKLRSIFDFEVVGTVSVHDAYESIKQEVIDLVITTVPLKLDHIKCVIVQPFLNEKNISELSIFFSQYARNIDVAEIQETAVVSVQSLLQIIGKNCTINAPEVLCNELSSLLRKNKIEYPALLELISEDRIQLHGNAETWQEAVQVGGRLLQTEGYVTQQYLEAMVENVQTIGSYIVLLPGIAMPHAKPSDGALKTGFSILILDRPVQFDMVESGEEGRVQVLITLAAVDYVTHTRALKELIRVLEQRDFLQHITQVQSKIEVLELFNIQ
ncbi:BglG family transcription antiterminator [Propionispira raffinosivorans]|uniref:BglG family transcription antiterminator n=1 Tax=Propionispira raffinosivorans TaxID=86959 RepID=UPI00037290B2|nr:BglG family transcription antiterminator [Propionispira raffinosivorans]